MALSNAFESPPQFSQNPPATGMDPAGALDWFTTRGARGVVIKLGPEGSAAWIHEACRVVPSIAVSPIDTTGAGDCFDAGFLWARLRGMELTDCLRCGNICGALSTEAAGGIEGFPRLERLRGFR